LVFIKTVEDLRLNYLILNVILPALTIRSLRLTETWLNNDIADGELNLFSYNVFRSDRNSTTSGCSRGGGVLISIRIDLPSYLIPVTCLDIETLFVSFTKRKKVYN